MISHSQRRPVQAPKLPTDNAIGLTAPLLATALLVALLSTLHWPRRWVLSGCAIESLAILYGAGSGSRVFPSISLWTLLATLNLTYAISSTSWLLVGLFTAVIYPCIFLTCLFQFVLVADPARKSLRKVLKQLHFTRDKIAFFNLPALEINTTVNGLFVIRGLTIQLSSLTIVAHGIELGLKLAQDIELALHVDQVSIPFFRKIEVGDVIGNIKGGAEMTFTDIETDTDEQDDDDSIFINNTPLLRSATAGSEGMKDRPRLRESMTGSYIKDSSAQAGFDSVKTLSPDDEDADQRYQEILNEIRTTGLIYQTRARVRQNNVDGSGFDPADEKALRAAVCAEMQELPSVPHPPTRSIKVTTLQNLASPAVRRFLHRLPLLLRVLLMPLSYFHPITISSISAAGSGKWLKALLKQQIFKQYTDNSRELQRLERRLSSWLADANFCAQLTDISGQAQVPLNPAYDIETYLRFADIIAYRTIPQSGVVGQVLRLGGADARFTLPSFLLPHHEHLLPAKPTVQDENSLAEDLKAADSKPKTLQVEKELTHLQKDETTVTMSVHGRLPVIIDQSLLNFVAALVKATKVIEFEKEVEREVQTDDGEDSLLPSAPSTDTETESPSTSTGFKTFTRKTLQGLRDSTTKEHMRTMARDLTQATQGMKRAVVGSMVNDRWIAKIVGKIAATLEEVHGDIGYSGDIPVALEVYRPATELPSKLLS